jgi:hypothetical protein
MTWNFLATSATISFSRILIYCEVLFQHSSGETEEKGGIYKQE